MTAEDARELAADTTNQLPYESDSGQSDQGARFVQPTAKSA